MDIETRQRLHEKLRDLGATTQRQTASVLDIVAVELDACVAAERKRWERACDAERAEFAERAANNDGSRQSDFAFGSVNSAERIKAAGTGPNV